MSGAAVDLRRTSREHVELKHSLEGSGRHKWILRWRSSESNDVVHLVEPFDHGIFTSHGSRTSSVGPISDYLEGNVL